MYVITHPDGSKQREQHWTEVAPLFAHYNVENASHLADALSPEGIKAEVARDGGSAWQDNEFDTRDANGEYVGCLVIEGEED